MCNIFVLSESLSSFNRNSYNYSAEKYEYNLCESLSKFTNVTILTTKLQFPCKVSSDNLVMYGVAKGKNKYAAIGKILNNYKGKSTLIFWGYDLIKCRALLAVKRRFNVDILPFIYDTHKVAIQNYNPIKKILAEMYFSFGKMLLRSFNGFIFFQERAANRLKIGKKPYIVIKPGVSAQENLYNDSYKDVFRVAYCGTLSKLNGIDALVESFESFVSDNIKFTICGVGPLLNDVLAAEERFAFVNYEGLINEQQLKTLYSNCDLLLNLRRTDDEAMDFAFPSKIFECIQSGIPVLTTKVLDNEEFINNTYVIDSVRAEDIVTGIHKAYNDRNNSEAKAKKAKKYIEEEYSFDKSAQSILDFIERTNH